MDALRIQANIGLFFLTISVDGLMSEMLLGAAALFSLPAACGKYGSGRHMRYGVFLYLVHHRH